VLLPLQPDQLGSGLTVWLRPEALPGAGGAVAVWPNAPRLPALYNASFAAWQYAAGKLAPFVDYTALGASGSTSGTSGQLHPVRFPRTSLVSQTAYYSRVA
jgi:hypothetical protein